MNLINQSSLVRFFYKDTSIYYLQGSHLKHSDTKEESTGISQRYCRFGSNYCNKVNMQ